MSEYTRTTHQSASWFRSRSNEGTLDKRPPFQRYFVWSARQQSALIETILLSYPIPEIYMQEGLSDEQEERYVIVDGQQRITTVLRYLADDFRLDNQVQQQYVANRFRDLSGAEQRRILQYQFVVRTLPSDWGEERLREVFSRLNRGVSALNDQELRHATYWGPFINCMEQLSSDSRWDELRIFSSADVRRMADVEFISEIAIAVLHGHQNKKDTLDRFYLLYEEDFEQEADIKQTFGAVLQILLDLFDELQTKRWRKKSDFYTLFVFLRRTRSFGQNHYAADS